MRSSDVFKIVIGDNWLIGSRHGGEPVTEISEHIDFGRVRDSVDIVVGGSSIFGRHDEDSIFFLARDFLFAVERLLEGDGSARVSFYEGPWELVLQRLGKAAYLTLYRGGQKPEVIVKDQRVSFVELVEGVLASVRDLTTKACEVDPGAHGDPLIVTMVSLADKLEKVSIDTGPSERAAAAPRDVVSTRWKSSRTERSFSFGFRFRATVTDLNAPGKPQGSDLNPLLFRGQHVVHARGRRMALGEGFLFLQTERLLASLRQLLTAWEEGRPMSSRLLSDGLVVSVRLGRDDGLVVGFMDSRNEDAIAVINDLTPWEYADAVLGVARELRRLIVDVSPSQRRNLRLEAFSREIKTLSNWTKEQRRGAIINEDVERYKRLTQSRRTSNAPVVIGDASRLRFSERWRIEVEGLDLDSTMLCDDLALISARGVLLGVETDSGAVSWRRETDRSDARIQRVGGDSFVRAAPSGQIELIDLCSGVLKWRTSLAPRSGGAPVLLVVEHGPAPGLAVAVEEEKRLVALDIRTGEPRWRFAASRGGRFSLRRYGKLMYVASNDSHFNALDVEDGSLVWRYTDRTQFLTPPAVAGENLIVVGGRPGRPEGRIYGLNAFSGELIWNVALSGGAMTAPIIADGVALIPARCGRQNELVGVDTATGEELWRKDCAGWAEPCALMALDKRFIINSAGGVLRTLDARTGIEVWRTALGPTCSDDIPLGLKVVLRGGVLFVPADTVYVVRPEDGHVIHSLGGDPPVPDLLQVDPSCSIFVAEDSGHIGMYNLTNRLMVVS